MKHSTARMLAFTLTLLVWSGCATSHDTKAASTQPPSATPEVLAAEKLYKENRYTEAIVACIEISRKDPLTPGLPDLQARIMSRLTQMRQEAIKAQTAASEQAAAADVTRQSLIPDTYRLTKHVIGETAPFHTAANKMQELLHKPISVHLENVNLADIVTQIGSSQNINIIADGGVGTGKTLTIHAENTPLEEILEYIGRNMGVTFSVGQNIIWATAGNDTQGAIPFETRVYRLRKGLPGCEIPGSGDLSSLVTAANNSTSSHASRSTDSSIKTPAREKNGKAKSDSGIAIIDAITRFVPQPKNADITFDARAHALLIRNTRENLAMSEEIINALDIRPQQVLIEARFVETTASDMRQLGIDWLLGGPSSAPNTLGPMPTLPNLVGNTATNAVTGKGIGLGQLQNGAGTFQYQGVLNNLQMQAIVSAMQSSGQTRTLTVPRITTVNNKTATIHIGEDFQYYDNLTVSSTTQYYNNSGPANNVSNNVPVFSGTPETIKLGYKLAVTPSVGADLSTINLALVPDITELQNKTQWEQANDPTSATVQQPGKLPIVLQKTIETEVVIRSGETVVMGGLAQASGGKTTTGIPWLCDLPFIGQLFRTDSDNTGTDNLLIFVTATLLSDVGEELIPVQPRELPGLPVAANEK